MGLRLSFFKTPKHKVFNYRPMYWNPEKEELDTRVRRAQAEAGILDEGPSRMKRSEVHGAFQKAMYQSRRHAGNQKALRIIVILSFAALLTALFYFTKFMEILFSKL